MQKWVCACFSLILIIAVCVTSEDAFAKRGRAARSRGDINAHSAILVDMGDGRILYEQDPDAAIAPASITKVLTLYIVFEALHDGRLRPWENVHVSSRAAQTGGSRMGLKTGHIVPVEELVKGMAVVSGNDACVAIAEHMAGSVEEFVRIMNAKARDLGMSHSHFTTPNGLPSPGQYSTARDIAKLSVAYLRRFPESLSIHSLQAYTYRTTTHHNANRLLGTCPGVDGLKTGFVCSAGYNQSATCKRGETRLLAVVLGAPSPGVRATETARLLELGYQAIASGSPVIKMDEPVRVVSNRSPAGSETALQPAGGKTGVKRLAVTDGKRSTRASRASGQKKSARASMASTSAQHQITTGSCAPTASKGDVSARKEAPGIKDKVAAKGKVLTPSDRSQTPVDSSRKASGDRKTAAVAAKGSGIPSGKQVEGTSYGKSTKTTKSPSTSSKNIIQGSDKAPAISKSKIDNANAKSGSSSSSTTKKKRAP